MRAFNHIHPLPATHAPFTAPSPPALNAVTVSHPMLGTGIIFGIAAALAQSIAYIFSRRYIITGHGGAVRLLVISHFLMGIVSIPVVAFIWSPAMSDVPAYLWDATGAAGFYLLGQASLFAMLRTTDASRIAPLLGLKIVVVAMFYVTLMGARLEPLQWLAVAVSVAAAFVLNYSGGSLPWPIIAATLFTCFTYALSDIHIYRLIAHMGDPNTFMAGARATALSYVMCGVMVAPFLWRHGSRRPGDWTSTLSYSAFWYPGQYCLFFALAMAGPVLGNIAIATRGLWSIALGVLLAAMGMVHLERRVQHHVLLRRVIAAVMMIAAIALYRAREWF